MIGMLRHGSGGPSETVDTITHNAVTQASHYTRPPLVETALSIQFDELSRLQTVHYGLFFARVRERFPHQEEAPRLPPIREHFPRPRILIPSINFGMPGPQRMILHNQEPARSDRLLQVQPDRIAFNWRRPPGESGQAQYPRYSETRPECIQAFQLFREFCREEGIEDPSVNLCEITYVNHIRPMEGEKAIDLFPSIFRGLAWGESQLLAAGPSVASFNRVYDMPNEAGRLYAEAAIGFEPRSPSEFLLLKMTARVRCSSAEARSEENALDQTHEWVVDGFNAITTEEAQVDRWGRIK